MNFNEFMSQVNDLDLIFFRGTDCISKSIVLLEKLKIRRSIYSHVGLVISKKYVPILNNDPPETKYIMESILSSDISLFDPDQCPDLSDNGYFFGVQIRNLGNVVRNNLAHGAKVALGKYDHNLDEAALNNFGEVYKRYIHLHFPIDILAPLFSLCPRFNMCNFLLAFDCLSCACKKTMFCSEFTAAVLQFFSLLPPNTRPNKIAPVDLENFCNKVILINL